MVLSHVHNVSVVVLLDVRSGFIDSVVAIVLFEDYCKF